MILILSVVNYYLVQVLWAHVQHLEVHVASSTACTGRSRTVRKQGLFVGLEFEPEKNEEAIEGTYCSGAMGLFFQSRLRMAVIGKAT